MVVRLCILFSLFLDNILILVAALRCCFDCLSSVCFVDAIFDLKLIPSSQKSKLSNWEFVACVAGSIVGGREIKFWRQSRPKRATKPQEILPARKLGYIEYSPLLSPH